MYMFASSFNPAVLAIFFMFLLSNRDVPEFICLIDFSTSICDFEQSITPLMNDM